MLSEIIPLTESSEIKRANAPKLAECLSRLDEDKSRSVTNAREFAHDGTKYVSLWGIFDLDYLN